jgi:hypothetical protein
MILEIAAGIVLGLFAFILIYKYWRIMLRVMSILIVIAICVVLWMIETNDPAFYHAHVERWVFISGAIGFVILCFRSGFLQWLDRIDRAEARFWTWADRYYGRGRWERLKSKGKEQ